MSPPERKPSSDRVRARGSFALVAWIVWCAIVSANYFAVAWNTVQWREPAELFPAIYWREALVRDALGLLGCAVVLLAGWWLGTNILRRARVALSQPFERPVFEVAIGFAGLSLLCLSLSWFGLYRPYVLRWILSALSALAIAQWWMRGTSRSHPWRKGDRIDGVFLLCVVAACGFALIAALAPEIEYDALWYHLWLPSRWLAEGRPVDLVSEYISLYPLGSELLYGCAMSVGGPVAAKLLHFICLPALGLIAAMLTRQWFPMARASAGAAISIVVPLLIWEAGTAYVDLAFACYIGLVAYALMRYMESSGATWLLLAAFTMGVALAIKNLALVAFGIAAIALAVSQLRRAGLAGAVRTVTLFVTLALLFPAPWYARAWQASGNPVFPDLYSVFGARPPERWDDRAERALARFKETFGRTRTPAHLLALPWDVTMHGARYKGTLGPIFLMLIPVALIAARRRDSVHARVWAVTGAIAAYGAIWASPISSFQLRFLTPAVPLLAALSAYGLSQLPKGAIAIVVPLLLVNLPPFTAWHERDRHGWEGWLSHTARGVPLQVVIGAESEQHYLARLVPSYRAWSFIDAHVPPGSRVLTFAGGDHLYSHVDRIWSDSPAARAATWDLRAGREAEAKSALARLRVTHVLFDRRQLEQTAAGQLAIASAAMRTCCLDRIYEDDRFGVYRLR